MVSVGRKQGAKSNNYHYCVIFLDDELKIKGRKYYTTFEELKAFFPMAKSTLWRTIKNGGINKKYKLYKFEKCKIQKELGDFFNITNTC